MRPILRPLAILLLISAVLAGCTGPMYRWGAAAPETDPQAEALLAAGDYDGAMRRFEYLARTVRNPDYYWLRAADAALRAGDAQSAQQLADSINPRELEGVDRNQYYLLASRLDLSAGRAREAMSKLDAISREPLEGGQRINYHTQRASAYNQLGDMLASARERVALGGLLQQSDAIRKNNEAIYDALRRLPPETLTQRQPPAPNTLGGWMALTAILKTTPPGKLSGAVNEWRATYPGHPADGAFLVDVVKEAGGTVEITPLAPAKRAAAPAPTPAPPPPANTPPKGPFVGVMLPLSGPYAPASEAIRSGMIAAYYADTNPGKPQLYFVDSGTGDVAAVYRKLADQGAQAVVGPLVKESVASIARNPDLPVPVLALNQTPEATNPQVLQFGLTPEHEVEQAAASAWFDGRQNALVLAPATQFGQRMIKHFTAHWRTLGGKIVAAKTYAHHGQDFSAPVRGLLGSMPADTASASFIFLIADARDARLILPQLATAQGSPLPVYALSHVNTGSSDSQADQDLNGLVFCDIPWLLNPSAGGPLSARSLEAQIRQTPPDYVKLIALGVDAYRLLPELERFRDDPEYRFAGVTGNLSLQSGNRLQRQLECAQFEGGRLQSRGPAPLLQPAAPAAGTP